MLNFGVIDGGFEFYGGYKFSPQKKDKDSTNKDLPQNSTNNDVNNNNAEDIIYLNVEALDYEIHNATNLITYGGPGVGVLTTLATGTLTIIQADLLIPDPSDLFLPKFAVEAILGGAALWCLGDKYYDSFAQRGTNNGKMSGEELDALEIK